MHYLCRNDTHRLRMRNHPAPGTARLMSTTTTTQDVRTPSVLPDAAPATALLTSPVTATDPSFIRAYIIAVLLGIGLAFLSLWIIGCSSGVSALDYAARLNPPVGTRIAFINDTSSVVDWIAGNPPQPPCSFIAYFPNGVVIPFLQLPDDWCSQFPKGTLMRVWTIGDSMRVADAMRRVVRDE